MPAQSDIDDETLDERLSRFRNDPLGFVRWAFPWAEIGTPLAGASGPEVW